MVLGVIATPASATETITYTYDALGRLATVVHSGSVNNGQQTVYKIDPADNRTNVTTTGASH
jgi:YD repeat-containing protein